MNEQELIEGVMAAAGDVRLGCSISVTVEHEDGCPAIKTRELFDCTCEPIIRKVPSNG